MITNLPLEERVQALYTALIEAWHDTTCAEGANCRDRPLHLLHAVGLERAAALSNHPAVMRVLFASPPIASSD